MSFITSFDEVTMSIFVASPETMTLPVRMYHHIAQTIDPLIASISTVLIVVLMASGLLLKFVYQPTPTHAYDSIVYLGSEVPLGQLLRNLHRWAAHAMVLLAILHMMRVFLTGAHKAPREFNWVIGVILLLLVVVVATVIFLTELTSNTATAAAFIPLLAGVAAYVKTLWPAIRVIGVEPEAGISAIRMAAEIAECRKRDRNNDAVA